jgi:hypothetical protein
MKHACFLRDPRTDAVVSEPRCDLPVVSKLKTFLPLEMNRVSASVTRLNLFGRLTEFFYRNSSCRTREPCILYLGAIVSSKRPRCTRTKY